MKKVGTVNTTGAQLRRFSDVAKSEKLMAKLMSSSRSTDDAKSRVGAYTKAYGNFQELEALRTRKQSAGLGDLSGLAPAQFVDVTVMTMITSISGFFSVERGMDSIVMTMPFVNILNADTDALISPNIGPDLATLQSAKVTAASAVSATTASIGGARAIVPGTVRILITRGGNTYVVTDNLNGDLQAPAGVELTVGTVNYTTGAIDFTVATAFTSYTAEWSEDHPKDPANRVKSNLKWYELKADAEVLIQENNLIADLVAQKSMNVPMRDITRRRLLEEYVKMINKRVVDCINLNYVGLTNTIDLSGYTLATSSTFETVLNAFMHGLHTVDTDLTDKSYKSVAPSAYLVGKRVAELFKSLTRMGAFTPNTASTYIEDLIGYYNGVPVIKSHRVGEWTGYATHKTSDGQMAPCARGIFLPVNDLPEVGNFGNPTQNASGVYSYEGTKLLTSELVQKFVVTPSAVLQ